ncbi:hypothetical protein CC86DRAFT_472098 [Ophiobolus disseminans]|uniref:Uncharacterized protein n=1 Tax=Ophiobolus disseminans TaxID=1469910 RepID=A0A6A6ZDS0_9PLEO|nr:hypothetical protein CC86DRAFT_472098 [Ophiobolus disseminans]
MRFFLPLAAFAMGVAALPASNVVRDGPANILSLVQDAFEHAPVVDGAEPFVIAGSSKRSVAVNAVGKYLVKRALVVDIWQNSDRNGRHEGLFTDTNKCYNLGNGWNDQVSSLSVPNGYGCDFFRNNDCNNNDSRLNVPGGVYVANLSTYGMNDMISSYRCYN